MKQFCDKRLLNLLKDNESQEGKRLCKCLHSQRFMTEAKKLFTLLDLCVSSLRRGHANLLCIVPILTDDPRRESNIDACHSNNHKTHWILPTSLKAVVTASKQKHSYFIFLSIWKKVAEGLPGCGTEFNTCPTKLKKKRREVVHAHHTEGIASCSQLLSLH